MPVLTRVKGVNVTFCIFSDRGCSILKVQSEVQESNLRPLLYLVLRLSAALSSHNVVVAYDSRLAIVLNTMLCFNTLSPLHTFHLVKTLFWCIFHKTGHFVTFYSVHVYHTSFQHDCTYPEKTNFVILVFFVV